MLTQADTTAVVITEPITADVPASAEVQTVHIRAALEGRLAELRAEHATLMADFRAEERGLLVPDAGDDVVDIGTKQFNRVEQVERALERLAAGGYGNCEGCAQPIPAARLAAFPSATQCVSCKQRSERR